MSEERRSTVEIHLDNGALAPQFSTFELRESFSDPIGSLKVDFVPLEKDIQFYKGQLEKGKRVHVHVDGKPQADMMIETLTTKIGKAGGVQFSVDAVAPLKLLYQASADPKISKSYANDSPVIDVIAELVDPFGIGEVIAEQDIAKIACQTGVRIKAKSTEAKALKHAEAQVQHGETCYQFAGRILTRLGCMLRMGANRGQVYITSPHYDGDPLYSLVQGREGKTIPGDRFIGDVTIVDTNDGQFSFCKIEGVAPDHDADTMVATPSGQIGTAVLNAERPPYRSIAFPYKPKFVRDTSCRDSKRAQSTAKLVLGLAAERAFVVSGVVAGLTSRDGIPWTIDTLCNVQLHPILFSEVMWINERTFVQDKNGGQSTRLSLIPKGYFVIGDVSS